MINPFFVKWAWTSEKQLIIVFMIRSDMMMSF